MTTEDLPARSAPNWGVVRAVLLIVAGAVVIAFGLEVAGSAGLHRAVVLVALGAAVLVLGLLATGARASRSACRVARRPGPEATAA